MRSIGSNELLGKRMCAKFQPSRPVGLDTDWPLRAAGKFGLRSVLVRGCFPRGEKED